MRVPVKYWPREWWKYVKIRQKLDKIVSEISEMQEKDGGMPDFAMLLSFLTWRLQQYLELKAEENMYKRLGDMEALNMARREIRRIKQLVNKAKDTLATPKPPTPEYTLENYIEVSR